MYILIQLLDYTYVYFDRHTQAHAYDPCKYMHTSIYIYIYIYAQKD